MITKTLRKKSLFFGLILSFFIVLNSAHSEDEQSPKKLRSTLMVNTIKDTFSKFVSSNNINDQNSEKELFKQISKFITIKPKQPIRDEDSVDYEAEAKKLTQKRYNLNNTQIKQKAQRAAEIKFQAASVGDIVTIYYSLGKRPYKLTGPLMALNEKGVTIGSKTIPIYDIDRNYQYLFNTKKRNSEKRAFIRKSVNKYKLKKELYAKALIAKLKKDDDAYNLKAGYLWYEGAWTSAKSIIDYLIRIEKDKILAEGKQGSPLDFQIDRNTKNIPKNYYKFLSKAQKYKQQVVSSNSGADTIAGYDFVVWDSSLETTYTLCEMQKYDSAKVKDKTSYRWYPNKNKTQYVTFYFNNDKMYKFVMIQEFKTYEELYEYANKVFAYYSYPEIFPTQMEKPMIKRPLPIFDATVEGKVNQKYNNQQYSWSGKKNKINFMIRASAKKFFVYVTVERIH